MSSLLIDDRPIMFLPKLAIALESVERAIILQQIHWLLQQPKSGKVVDGNKWVWGSYEEWCEDFFPMWKPQNLAKHIRKLEESGVLISAELNAAQHDHTKHYRIDYEHPKLQSILYSGIVSKRDQDIASKRDRDTASIYRTETSSESAPQKEMRPTQGRKGSGQHRATPPKAPQDEKKDYLPDNMRGIIRGYGDDTESP